VKSVQFDDGNELPADLVLMFHNNFMANTEFLGESEPIDQIDFDNKSRIRVDFHQRTDYKRIFAAGDGAATLYFGSFKRMPCTNWNVAWHQGVTSAYNILGLGIPWN